jgi:hypothetical protein
MDDAVWNHAVFSKNHDRLLTSEVAQRFFVEVNRLAKRFMSDEHFTVDGTLIQAWASQKSFRPKDGSDDGDGSNFHGQKRSNNTHQSTTDARCRHSTPTERHRACAKGTTRGAAPESTEERLDTLGMPGAAEGALDQPTTR